VSTCKHWKAHVGTCVQEKCRWLHPKFGITVSYFWSGNPANLLIFLVFQLLHWISKFFSLHFYCLPGFYWHCQIYRLLLSVNNINVNSLVMQVVFPFFIFGCVLLYCIILEFPSQKVYTEHKWLFDKTVRPFHIFWVCIDMFRHPWVPL